MDLRKITDEFTVSPQIEASDIPDIVAAGYQSVLCNRPDGEELNQCPYDDVAQAAQAAGLEVRSVPIFSGMVRPEDLDAFNTALSEMPQPVLAYCRTGTRCTMLWTIAKYSQMDADEILKLTGQAGYDMSGIVQQMSQR